jgi:hypothetical protein
MLHIAWSDGIKCRKMITRSRAMGHPFPTRWHDDGVSIAVPPERVMRDMHSQHEYSSSALFWNGHIA